MISWDSSNLRARALSIAEEVLGPNAAEWDRGGVWPEAALRELQSAGLCGLLVPPAFGGAGEGYPALLDVCELLGNEDASTALCFGMHCVATACIVARSTEDQAARFLVPIAAGHHLTTLALSEPGTGSHFYLPETKLRRSLAEAYSLSGTKSFVTSGGNADSYVVSAVTDDAAAPPGHFSLLVVPKGVQGMRWGDPWTGWGMRGNASRSVELSDVVVPGGNLLGKEGEQIWFVFSVVAPYFLAAMAGTYVGVAAHALREVTAHLKQRQYTHTGGALSEVSVLQHRLGTLWAKVARTRELCRWAVTAAQRGDSEALPALCAAKAEAGRNAVEVTNECMSLAGGRAYRDGAVLQRLLRDARAAEVMSPTTDMLFSWIGRSALDLPLLGE